RFRLFCGREREPRHAHQLAHGAVHVEAGRRQHHARRVLARILLRGHDDRVRGGFEAVAVVFTERGGVRVRGIDLDPLVRDTEPVEHRTDAGLDPGGALDRRLVHEARHTSDAMACPTSAVDALPPRSRVTVLPSSTRRSIAATTARAASGWPWCSSIIAPVQTCATGFAMPLPAMSGAEPCTGSNIDGACFSGLMLASGAAPSATALAGPAS